MPQVAVDKRFGMLDSETDSLLQATRTSGTSTPFYAPAPTLQQFLRQNGSLDFTPERAPYTYILEEKDDALYRWYPMRISYSRRQRAIRINQALHSHCYETYLHLQSTPKDAFGNPREDTHQGPVYNLVFVHAMKIQLKLLKRFDPDCQMMQFIVSNPHTDLERRQIVWVPDLQMQNFIDAATRPDPLSQRIPLTYNDFIGRQGRRVRVVAGPFTGIDGEIKRIGRHRIVVALLREAQVAVGITHIPPECLEFL